MFCGSIPPLAGDIPRRRMDVGAAKLAWGVAWPFCRPTLPVEKSSEFKFGEYSSQSARKRNSTTAANWFRQCRPALNLPKGVFSVRLRPSGPRGPHAVSKALGRCRRFSRSPAKTVLRRRKSARSAAHSARIGSFRYSAVASGPDQRLKAFSHWKPCFSYCWGLRKS